MIIISVILLVMLGVNLAVIYKLQLMTERIDDNLVDIEMMKMQVEQVTKELSVAVFRLQEKIRGL